MPANTVKVDRTTRWGNPWKVDDHLCAFDAVAHYRSFLAGIPWDDAFMNGRRTYIIDSLPALRGKNLACWCRVWSPCHADVLLELANQ